MILTKMKETANVYLGGEDLDNRIVDFCMKDLKCKNRGRDCVGNQRAPCRLRTRCERPKQTLSDGIVKAGGGAFGHKVGPKQGTTSCGQGEKSWLKCKRGEYGDESLSDGTAEYAHTMLSSRALLSPSSKRPIISTLAERKSGAAQVMGRRKPRWQHALAEGCRPAPARRGLA